MPFSIHTSLFPVKRIRTGITNKLLWTTVATLFLCQACYRCYEIGLFGETPDKSAKKRRK